METFEDKLSRVLAERIAVVDYDPAWPTLFEAEASRLGAHFPPGSIRLIEHIGSTAVPGLAAKPIIDILVGVDDFGFVVDSVAPAMERAGYDYFFRPEIGDEGTRYPWFIGRDASGARVSHIHVVLIDDAPQWDRVVFRDYLRSHPDATSEYAALKRELAGRLADDREAYTRAKTEFITGAIERARAAGLAAHAGLPFWTRLRGRIGKTTFGNCSLPSTTWRAGHSVEVCVEDDTCAKDGSQGTEYSLLFRAGSIAAFATVAVTLLQIILGVLWPPPDFAPTAAVAESMLQMVNAHPIRAFVTMDGLMVFDYLMLIVVYLALYVVLHPRSPALTTLGVALALVATTLYFTANPSITMFALGAQYAEAASGVVPAAQAVLAGFEGTAFIVHYVVMGIAGILVSAAMFGGAEFSRATAIAGVLQGAMMLIPVTFGILGLVFALGSLIPFVVWFTLVGVRLRRLAVSSAAPA